MTATTVRLILRCPACDTVASVLEGNETVYLADHAMRCVPRPMSIAESEAKRNGGGVSASDTTSGATSAVNAGAPSSAPCCAECGVELFDYEIARQADVAGSKFAGMCNDCCHLKLGLV